MSRLLAPMLALVLALVAGGCNEQRTTLAVEPAANPKPASTPAGGLNLRPAAQREIVVEPVQLKLLAGTLTLPGKVQYSEDQFAKIASPLIGRVTEVHARLGEKVIAGEVLVSLQSADIGAAYSDYMKAQSDLEFSTRSHELAREHERRRGALALEVELHQPAVDQASRVECPDHLLDQLVERLQRKLTLVLAEHPALGVDEH